VVGRGQRLQPGGLAQDVQCGHGVALGQDVIFPSRASPARRQSMAARTSAAPTGHSVRADRIGVVVHEDDPLAQREEVTLAALTNRRWIQLPEGTDPVWCSYWTGAGPRFDDDLPVMKTIQECLQSVLWNGTSALAPLNQSLPRGLVVVPVTDREPCQLVVAWNGTVASPLIGSFVEVAAALFNSRT